MVFDCMEIGRLKTHSRYYVAAGDALQIEFAGLFMLAPLRRRMLMDCRVDVFVFYVPHSHVYGADDWHQFIEEGIDNGVTFPGVANTDSSRLDYLAFNDSASTVPKHVVAGYNQIHNEYFRDPSDRATDQVLADDSIPGQGPGRDFGRFITKLPRAWTTLNRRSIHITGVDDGRRETNAADRSVSVASGDVIDVREIDRTRARFHSELSREFFGDRYRDVLRRDWGTYPRIFQDPRPELLWREKLWMGGRDTSGTDDATLGTSQSQGATIVSFRMPRRSFPEHGIVWLLSAIRFPPVSSGERHWLDTKVDLSYKEMACDRMIMSAEPPLDYEAKHFFNSEVAPSQSKAMGRGPYGLWHYEQPHYVHPLFVSNLGFPLIDAMSNHELDNAQIQPDIYGDIFHSAQLGNCTLQAEVDVTHYSCCPDPMRSIFSGA